MAEKYLKIIQNGIESYVPDTQRTREFWTKQNSRVSRSYAADKETVTILQAKPDEVEFMTKPVAQSAAVVVAAQSNDSKLSELEALVRSQQELINKFMLGAAPIVETEPKERAKPGPKPKTENNGEGQ